MKKQIISENEPFELDSKKHFDELMNYLSELDKGKKYDEKIIAWYSYGKKTVKLKNYVGVIQMRDGFQVEILPKITADSETDDYKETKKLLNKMLGSLKSLKNSKAFGAADLKPERNIYEIFISVYLQEVRRLVKKGLKSNYDGREDNLRVFKGRLLTAKHMRENLVHKERFYVAYDEFSRNCPENRIIKLTLEKLTRLTADAGNAREAKQLLMFFDEVARPQNLQQDLARFTSSRNTRDYEDVIAWSRVFREDKSFAMFSSDVKVRSLLFPMWELFECYVAKYVKRIFTADGWEVKTQDSSKTLFDNNSSLFRLRPDIVLKQGNRVVIMDTKWRTLKNDERKNYGIERDDVYQMNAYADRYKKDNGNKPVDVWLLYPYDGESEPIKELKNDSMHLHIFKVDIKKIESGIEDLKKEVNSTKKDASN